MNIDEKKEEIVEQIEEKAEKNVEIQNADENSTEEFKEGFILQSIFIDNYQKYTPNVLSNPVLRLTTASLGKKAYILAQKLSEFIDTINVQ